MQLLESDAIIVTTAGYFSKIVSAIIHKRGLSVIAFSLFSFGSILNIIQILYRI